MTPTDLRVPLAALPGIDPTWLVLHHHTGWSGVVVRRSPRGSLVCYAGGTSQLEPADALLDLADASTRDRVARWCAARAELEVGPTAPGWRGQDNPPGHPGWVLHSYGSGSFFSSWTSTGAHVPTLADLAPADSSALPDGSRSVDAIALGRVAVHLGSQS